ncbi:hypothetical protein D3C80_1889670 [compost metagenome]
MDGGDAHVDGILRTLKLYGLTIKENFTFIGTVNAGQNFHQRRFSSAVLTDQGRDLARIKRDVDAIQRFYAGKYLADASHLQDGRLAGGSQHVWCSGFSHFFNCHGHCHESGCS